MSDDAIEIERKFTVPDLQLLLDAAGVLSPGDVIEQWYPVVGIKYALRLRLQEFSGTLNIKSREAKLEREELEFDIPIDMAKDLAVGAGSRRIIKNRYPYIFKGWTWDIDEFLGENSGLVLAELELDPKGDRSAPFEVPSGWTEVTGDYRYYNEYLALHPYCTWKDSV